MKILFKTPTFDKPTKEKAFIKTVHTIPAYKSLAPMESHYLLELDNSRVTVETIQQLFVLFDTWGIDKSPLESFVQYVEASSEKSGNTSH